jgi:hypothetical protein
VQLTVNDGLLDSIPADQVIIDTENSKPVADAGPNQPGTVGKTVMLDGSHSFDIDDDPLSFVWSLLNKPASSLVGLEHADQSLALLTPDQPGDYVAQLIVNDSKTNSDPATTKVTVSVAPPINRAPVITSSPSPDATVGKLYNYAVEATDDDKDSLTFSLSAPPAGMTINAQSGLIAWTPTADQLGAQKIMVNVDDGKGGSDSQSFRVTVTAADQVTVPDLLNKSRTAAETAIQQSRLNLGSLSFEYNPAAEASVIGQNPGANTSAEEGAAVNLTISLGPDQGLPPNPETVAPRIDPTVATNTYASTQFLYTGSNPIQTGVQPATIELKRAAVIRGKVLDKQNNPLPGVTITIKDHPEYGQTLSRADGWFDMAVNGGGYLTVNYQKSGFLPAQRLINTPWQDYVMAEDVVLTQLDSQVTTIDLTSTAPCKLPEAVW